MSQVATIVFALLFSNVPIGATRSVTGLALFAAIVSTLVTSSGALYWRCPRCHEQFFVKRGRWTHNLNIFARYCVHCGLPKWAEGDLQEPSAR
ncbi:MAG: hypothetical protein H0U66_14155 [Gemmatimonadaceae bacterium]|nr:hypothetical protein [Gemmatimonadaceae bacterium]